MPKTVQNQALSYLKKKLLHLPLSVRCLLCKGKTTLQTPLCNHCQNLLPVPEASCSRCGMPLPESDAFLCGQCLHTPPHFDHCLSAFSYAYPVNHIIAQIKYHQRIELIQCLTPFLMEVLFDHYQSQPWPDVIVPVPMHKKRLSARGYNQAQLIANGLYRQMPDNNPCQLLCQLVNKHKNTQPQQTLPAKVRQKNIKGTFVINNKITFDHAAIVDDVVTTGETVGEISRLLKRKGVRHIDIWCLARTPSDK